jgi:hypothetical protein
VAKTAVFKYEAYCDGYGMLVCHCGGDLCVCGEDGQDCYGCEKCAGRDEDEYLEDDPSKEGHAQWPKSDGPEA